MISVITIETEGPHTVRSILEKETGKLSLKQIFLDESLHCESGPASIRRNPGNSVIVQEYWKRHGVFHRDDGPALVTRNWSTGAAASETWFQHGRQHRVDGPSSSSWHNPGGALNHQCWSLDGELHRTDGPAVLHYSPSGILVFERWHQHGKLHRADGPAEIRRDPETGAMLSQVWWLDGKPLRAESEPQLRAAPAL